LLVTYRDNVMRICHFSIGQSPFGQDRIRTQAEISYDDRRKPPEVCWYDFPAHLAKDISISGNAWLAAYLPLAVTLREPLRLEAPVDRNLLDGVLQVMEIWHAWHPHLPVVPIEVEAQETSALGKAPRTAAFFSGGVDSFFTLLRNTQPSPNERAEPIDDLLLAWGFDISLDHRDAFERMRIDLQRAATTCGKNLYDVVTNLRQTRFSQAEWGRLAHGAALASIGLHLEHRYDRILIPSSGGYKELLPWGSHVITDPLFSTKLLKIVQDGAAFSRTQKLERIAGSPLAQQHLRVCWRSGTDRNCGECGKCLRAMVVLEALGVRHQFTTFPLKDLNLSLIRRIYYDDQHMIERGWDLHNMVLRKGRPDIAKVVQLSLRRSLRLQRWAEMARSLRTKRFVWRWADQLERTVLAGSIL
jgi:hypothetical protein